MPVSWISLDEVQNKSRMKVNGPIGSTGNLQPESLEACITGRVKYLFRLNARGKLHIVFESEKIGINRKLKRELMMQNFPKAIVSSEDQRVKKDPRGKFDLFTN